MQLLENANRVTTLATPLLLVANNEVSRIFIGQERSRSCTNIGSQTNQNQTQSLTNSPNTTIDLRNPVGTTLLITPNINADRTGDTSTDAGNLQRGLRRGRPFRWSSAPTAPSPTPPLMSSKRAQTLTGEPW